MLVSCLTPTADRREFWPRCIRCFQSQGWPRMEWIVVDNGADPIKDMLPEDPRIKYVRVPGPRLLHGRLMNLAMGHAAGDAAIVWDDDDWYAPDRVGKQASVLENSALDLAGTGSLYYYLHGTRRAFLYRNLTPRRWVAAPAFRRSLWEANKFEEMRQGADAVFLSKVPEHRCLDMRDLGLLVSAIHPGNAAPKRVPNASFAEVPWETIEGITKGTL